MNFARFVNIARTMLVGIGLLGVCRCAEAQDEPDIASNTDSGIHWASLLEQSFYFDAIENGFRVATQPDTRTTMGGPFFRGYARSLDDLHGWADGDPFFVNYVGHPMQGSVAGFLFVQNDPKFMRTEFGRNREYWKSRLRATFWAWAYSEQFELGPLSEATIGHTQEYFPQQGLVDHVITPTIGLVWMIGEDSIDRYIVRGIEDRTQNSYLKLLARGGLNPSRSLANILRGKVPWYRDTRRGVFYGNPHAPMIAKRADEAEESRNQEHSGGAALLSTSHPPELSASTPPWLEIGTSYDYFQLSAGHSGSQSCNGGSATLQYNANSWFGLIAEVAGCKMLSAGTDVSGDSTTYVAGPRFTLRKFGRWEPYIQILGGGDKFTVEYYYPERRPSQAYLNTLPPYVAHAIYTSADQRNSWAIQFGGGVNYVINSALGVRVAEIDDVHTWAGDLNQRFYSNNLRVSTGLVLRWGSW